MLLKIAETCYEATRVWIDDRPPWSLANQRMQDTFLILVTEIIANPNYDPEQRHYQWCNQKMAEGWVYGPERDEVKKTDPNIVSFEKLPTRKLDRLIVAIVRALYDNPSVSRSQMDSGNSDSGQ